MALQEKVFFIAGATGGIGSAVTEYLLEQGARVGLSYRDEHKKNSLAENWQRFGDRFMFVKIETARTDTLLSAVHQTRQRYGKLAGGASLVGGFSPGLLHETADEVWLDQIDLNVHQAFYFSRALVPGLIADGGGSMVFLSSISARNPQKGAAAYAISKAALNRLVETLALEVKAFHLRVNAICPAMVATPANLREATGRSEKMVSIDAISRQVAYLLSDASAPLTGNCLYLPEMV